LSTLATLHYLVTSPAGNDWTLQQLNKWVPGLTISNASGQLDEALSFDLIYQDESVSLTIDRANISLDAKCLWQLAACVKQLSIETLIIDIPEISESNSDTESEIQQRQATEFSRVTMPVLLKIKTATLGKLLITGANSEYYRAEQITFSGRWIDHRIRLIEVTAQDDYCDWRFPFSIRLTGFYQIKADMSCNTEMYPLKQLQAKVDGDLRQLAIRFETNGDLAAKGKANLALLSDKLPIDFNLQLLSPFPPVQMK
ncbi:MAG: hypothetical protein MI976_25315, partial [Pseudomonadales bacterium]|nr:hypothetical protein [Pseudomonadales bacterium]